MSAPPFGPALVTLVEFLALPLTTLAAIWIHGWWRERHPRRTKERP